MAHWWPNHLPLTKPFTHDQTVHRWLNRLFMPKPFTRDQTVHLWPNRSLLAKPSNRDQAVHLLIKKIIIIFLGTLLLWYFLGKLYDCDTSLGLYDSDTSCGPIKIVKLPWISMVVKLPGVFLWRWYFLCLFMIVTLPEPLWLCQFPVPLYDCNTSWAFMIVSHCMIVKHPGL